MLIELYKLNNNNMALALDKRIWNTIWLPVRTVGTVLYWWLDAVNTVVTLPKQSLEIISNTTGQIKDVLSRARSEKKWYHRVWKAPVWTIMAAGTAIEWLWRAIVNPIWNTTLHTRDVLWNLLVNPWNAIKSVLSDKPVSEFKYEHLKTRDISKKNRVSNLFLSKIWWVQKVEEKKSEDKPKTESKWPSEKEITLEKKVWELEAENKWLKSTVEKLIKQQEETSKKLAELLSAKKEDWGKIIKWDFKKWPKDKTPGERPWKKVEMNTRTIDNEEFDEETNEKLVA